MPLRHRLTPIEVLQRLQLRLEKRMDCLQRTRLESFAVTISELEVELDLLRRAQRYLEEGVAVSSSPKKVDAATGGGAK